MRSATHKPLYIPLSSRRETSRFLISPPPVDTCQVPRVFVFSRVCVMFQKSKIASPNPGLSMTHVLSSSGLSFFFFMWARSAARHTLRSSSFSKKQRTEHVGGFSPPPPIPSQVPVSGLVDSLTPCAESSCLGCGPRRAGLPWPEAAEEGFFWEG